MKKNKEVEVYICKVDFDYHIPDDKHGIKVFFSKEDLEKNYGCVKECGIVKAKLQFVEEISASKKPLQNNKTKKKVMYDPPSGWKYGFPKEVPESVLNGKEEDLKRWIIDQGYPKKDIELALKYGRYWETDKE